MKVESQLTWFKSTYSSGEGGDCVEVANCARAIHVRDSKNTDRPGLAVAADTWSSFVGFAAAQTR